jgi:cysteine desulfurase
VKIDRLVGGGEQERGLRGGTLNVPAIVGFGEAVKRLEETRARKEEKILAAQKAFLEGLDGVEYSVNGENRLPAILNLRIHGVQNATLLYRADLAGVMLAAGSACSSASVKPSHVLTAMGLPEDEAKECVRVSFGEETAVEECAEAARILKEIILELRKN